MRTIPGRHDTRRAVPPGASNRSAHRRRPYHILLAALALGLAVACVPLGPVRSSALASEAPRAPSVAPVTISATGEPLGARQIGIVEVTGQRPGATLNALVDEFRARVASMGGDYGRIDSIATRRETSVERHEYDCSTDEVEVQTQVEWSTGPDGTPTANVVSVPVSRHVFKTCTEERPIEVATTTLLGRAFVTGGREP